MQELRHLLRGDVGDEGERAAVDDGLDARAGLADVIGRVAVGLQIAAVVVQVFRQRPAAVSLERVEEAGLAQLRLAHQFGEHLLGGGLVGGQRLGEGNGRKWCQIIFRDLRTGKNDLTPFIPGE
ncbi:MAG TPA: hypothetical protein VKA46_28785 [Gemmataceae bacterium]|nr:hypothetical protein [Gemmataceae bacterium]